MRRWTPRLTLVTLVTLALTATGHPSASAACTALDAACQGDEVLNVGEGIVDNVIAPIETPLDDIFDPVVDPIVDDVFDTADDIVGGGTVDLPDPIGGGDGGGTHVGGPPAPHEPPGAHTPTAPEERGAVGGAVGGRSPDGPGLTSLPGPTISAAPGVAQLGSAGRTSGNRLGEVVGGVARSLAIVFALFGLAVAFVSIQDRFDRNDPRLALAPVESDVVEFA